MSEEKKKRVIQYYEGKGGCAFWRMLWQGFLLNSAQAMRVIQNDHVSRNILDYAIADVVHIQKKGSKGHLNFFKKLRSLKDRFDFRMIYEVDDALLLDTIPRYNQSYDLLADIKQDWKFIEIMELCDELTVTTHALKKYYQDNSKQQNITVIPNFVPSFWIGKSCDEANLRRNYRRQRSRPRIMFCGSASHFDLRPLRMDDIVDDFTPVREAVLNSLTDFQWVFVGAIPQVLQPFAKKGIVEFHSWKRMHEYPRFLASLKINMCIAPLMNNPFNECKSDLKFLEASALGLPIACQNMCTYSVAPIRFDTGEEMIQQLNATLKTEVSYIEASREGRKLLQLRWLENKDNIGKYEQLYTFPYNDYRRTLL